MGARAAAALAVGAVGTALLAGCGPPPELSGDRDPPPPASATASPGPTGRTPGSPTPPGSTGPGFEEDVAVSCGGRPAADEVLDVLRREELLADGADADVVDGPLCAGEWQYAVVGVPDRDPLLVVTRGAPGALELVTAGTDVCTVEVRIRAPAGIRDAAACVG